MTRMPDERRTFDTSPLERIERWYAARGWTPFGFQREVWDAYLGGESGLVHAATGTGKTLAAWIAPLMEWMSGPLAASAKQGTTGARSKRAASPPLRVVWVTPLRALAADTAESLTAPLTALD